MFDDSYTHYAAKAVANALKNKTTLNEEIAKIAEEHDLTKIKIANIVHNANHALNGYLRENEENKSYTFGKTGMADISEIMKILNKTEEKKTASCEAILKIASWNLKDSEELNKIASDDYDCHYNVEHEYDRYKLELLNKLNYVHNELDKIVKEAELQSENVIYELDKIYNDFKEELRTQIFFGQDPFMMKKACCIFPEEILNIKIAQVFDRAIDELEKEGSYTTYKVKNPDYNTNEMKVPDEKTGLTTDMQIQLIDGTCPIVAHIDRINDQYCIGKEMREFLGYANRARGYIVKKIEVLDSPEKVKEYLDNEITDKFDTVLKELEDNFGKIKEGKEKTAFLGALGRGLNNIAGRVFGKIDTGKNLAETVTKGFSTTKPDPVTGAARSTIETAGREINKESNPNFTTVAEPAGRASFASMDNFLTDKLGSLATSIQDCLDENDFSKLCKIAGMLIEDDSTEAQDFLKTNLGEVIKLAASEFDQYFLNRSRDAKTMAALLGVGLTSLPIAYFAHQHSKEKKGRDEVLQKLLSDPTLGADPDTTKRYFDKIVKYSPSIASDPDVVMNTLKEWHRMGGKSIQPDMIGKLMSIEQAYGKGDKTRHPIISTIAGAVGTGALLKMLPELLENLGTPKRPEVPLDKMKDFRII